MGCTLSRGSDGRTACSFSIRSRAHQRSRFNSRSKRFYPPSITRLAFSGSLGKQFLTPGLLNQSGVQKGATLPNIFEKLFPEAKLRQARQDAILLRRRGLCFCISMLAVFAPLGFFRFTSSMMTKGEIAFIAALMLTATAFVLILNGPQLLLGMLILPLSLFGVSLIGFFCVSFGARGQTFCAPRAPG